MQNQPYHYRLDNYDKAFELEFKALSIRQKNETTRPCDLAISYYHLCDFYGDKGDYDKAIYYGKQAVSILKKDHDALGIYLQALASLGCNSIYAGDFSLAKESIETGLELCSNNNMTESLIEGLLFTHLGMMYTASGDFYSALHYTEKGSNILKKEAGDKHDYYAYALNNLGIICISHSEIHHFIK